MKYATTRTTQASTLDFEMNYTIFRKHEWEKYNRNTETHKYLYKKKANKIQSNFLQKP